MDCIFCKIVNGDIPAYKIYEDDDVLAFLDITQATKGHTLVIPKKHVENIYALDDVTSQAVFSKIPTIANAIKDSLNPIGLNILQNNDQPLQSVFHFHVHLIPRYQDDETTIGWVNHQKQYQEADYKHVQTEIRKSIK